MIVPVFDVDGHVGSQTRKGPGFDAEGHVESQMGKGPGMYLTLNKPESCLVSRELGKRQ